MNRSILASARRGSCLLLFASLLTCGRVAEVNIAVNLPDLPLNARSVDAILKLDGRQVGTESFTQELEGAGPRLGFKLPAGTRGSFEVELLAKDADGCVFARSVNTVVIIADKLETIDAAFGNKLPAPVISQVSQRYVRNDQDVKLTVTGEHLYSCSDVLIGDKPVKDLQFISPTEISLTAPMRKMTCGPAEIKLTRKDMQVGRGIDLLRFYAPTPTFGTPMQLAAPNYSFEMLLADFTGDRELDIVIVGTGPTPSPKLLAGRGNGTFAAVVNVPPPGVTIDSIAHLTAGDVNGDGLTDLLFACHSTVATPVHRVCASVQVGGTLSQAVYTDVPMQASEMTVGDLDGDNKPDLVALFGSGSYQLGVLRGNGNGTFDTTGYTANLPVPTTGRLDSIELADFNRDGKLDILGTFTYMMPQPMLGTQLALATGSRMFGSFTPTSTCNEARGSVIGDANGDGAPDLFIGQKLCTNTNNGTASFTEHNFFFTPDITSPNLVDINGDGLLDVAVIDNFLTNVASMLRNSDGTYRLGPGAIPSDALDALRLGDLNGDGIADLLVSLKNQQKFEVRFGVCN